MITKLNLCLCALLFFTTSLCAQTIPNGRYAIFSKLSGLAIEVDSASSSDGANVQQWGYTSGDWQHFDVAYQGNGYYSIRMVHSGMSLDVYNFSTDDGGEIRQWTYAGGDNQLWSINDAGNGYFTVTSKLSGKNLDVWGWSTSSGGDIRQFTATGADNQLFSFNMAYDGQTTINNGRYAVVSRHSGLAMEVASASADDGANIQQWSYGAQKWQQFDVTYQGNGYYSLTSAYTSKSLDVYGMSTEDGANIVQWGYWGGDGQLWSIQATDSGYYTIASKLSGKALDVWEWSTSNGGDIRQYSLWGGYSQQFRFDPVSSNTPDGFASVNGMTTGGAGGATITINNCSELASALASSDTLTIQIPDTTIECRTEGRAQAVCPVQCSGSSEYTHRVPVGTQTCTELGSTSDATTIQYRYDTRMDVASNKTVVGLGPNSAIQGGSFNVSGVSNLIFRNFRMFDINPHLVEAGGAISMDSADHIWIDHMRFDYISDGYTDMVNVQNITLSWNHFDGYNTYSCDDHHSYVMFADDSTVTFHHNFFDQGGGRNPKLNKSTTRAHLYNNYWYDITYFATNTGNGAHAKIEGNYYNAVSRPHWNESGYMDADMGSNVYTGGTSTSSYADTGDSVFTIPYVYSVDNASDLANTLPNQTGPQ